ncbi:hypothetical protein GCM10027429_10630 [Marivirga atlantica]|jgi:hypothetical protein|uniref:Uncharacterized protein n=1 Tax=Marivirga atlantica TaxID=1548457 RepID=A0A937DIZ1_9BACT|nr:hypothetical protein [Marivirga atlantica]MBL0764676.1 hypothetical protein [Marivirga atlantica]
MNFELNLSKCIKVVAVLIALLLPSFGWTQNTVGIGTETPNENAVLHLVSTGNNQGLLIPSMSTTQRTSSTFIDDLTTSDNGLLVFDLTEKQFYYWQDTQWVNLSPQAQFNAGNGISISGNTISNLGDLDSTNEIQDLVLTGNNLSISNNPGATSIDLTPFSGTNTDNQNLTLTSINDERTIDISGGSGVTFSVADNDNDRINEIQDLILDGNALSITNNPNATAIDLSPFVGSNTDNQNLSVTNSGENRTINITGGDGVTFSIADNDNDASNEIQNLSSVLSSGNDAGGASIANLASPSNNNDAATKLYVDNNVFSGNFADLNGIPSGLVDGDDVGLTTITTNTSLTGDGTSGSPLSIANNGVTTARIANGAVTNAKINDVAPSKINAGGATTGQALVWDGSNWGPQTITTSIFNTTNVIPKGNGSTQVASRIFDNGTYLGIGRTSLLTPTSFVDIDMPISGSAYGGFNLNSTSATGRPYLGFWLNGTLSSYIFQDQSNALRFYSGGTAMSIDNAANVGIGVASPSAKLDVVGSTELNGTFATPATAANVTGTINLAKPTRRIVRLTGSAGIPAIISTISPGDDGQEVILLNAGAITIRVNGAANVINPNSVILDNFTVSLSQYSTLHLIYDTNVGAWVEVSRSINDWILN